MIPEKTFILFMRQLLNIPIVFLIATMFMACEKMPEGSDSVDQPGSSGTSEARVVRVIDGDTVDVLISGTRHRVRLFGVDTPERGERCYMEAAERTRELSGDVVVVESGPRTEDRYGRLLFYLFTQGGESIDAILVREGLATAWTKDGQYRDLLLSMEKKARSNGTGCLW